MDYHRGFIIGGFASIKWFYFPLKCWLRDNLNVDCRILPEGFLGWNVGDIGKFFGTASQILLKEENPVYLFGHSLGGLQSIWLASNFPTQVKHIFAIASPIKGLENPRKQAAFLKSLNVTSEQFTALQVVQAPKVCGRITTISAYGDIVSPPSVCYLEGADNRIVSMNENERKLYPLISTHLILPYLDETKKCVKEKI